MNTKRGKGYFIARGARARARHATDFRYLLTNKDWPQWAQDAFLAGWLGA